jgi:hypothetical protein
MEDTGKIYELIPKVMREIGIIGKDRHAGSGKWGYAFRGIDDVVNVLSPILQKHGVFFTPEVLDVKSNDVLLKGEDGRERLQCVRVVIVKYTFHAPDGSAVTCVTTGEGADNGDKASNKALSGALKYALLQVFCIPTEDLYVDQEQDNTERAPARQQQPPPKRELTEHDKLVIQLNEAMEAKGYTEARQQNIAVGVLKKHKVATVQMLPVEKLKAWIEAVKAGAFDQNAAA